MVLLRLSVEFAVGVTCSEKRGVAFLRGLPDLTAGPVPDLTAGPVFDAISDESVGKRIKHRMGLWIQFKPDTKGKFHGFKEYDAKYRECFTFIDLEAKIRFYGFRCHPKSDDQRYEIVLLTSCVDKKEDAVNMAELDRVLMWKNHMATKLALTEKFSKGDSKKGK